MSAIGGSTTTQTEQPALEEEDAEDGDSEIVATFETHIWVAGDKRYGKTGLLKCLQDMLPIEKPDVMRGLKYLVMPGFSPDDAAEEPRRGETQRSGNPDRRKNKGRGKGSNNSKETTRFVPEMGKSEPMPGHIKGQWWRNVSDLDVVVREQISLMSSDIWKVPAGHYVQQAGPVEVFISGQATGLQRMPVFPRGWVTSDATAVNGPRYLQPVGSPRWKVVFKSDSAKADILVRQDVSLESDEIGITFFGSHVYQVAPQETLEDGIIRMKISFQNSNESSLDTKWSQGWVTCDATSQGGPKFFEACPEEPEPSKSASESPEGASNNGYNADPSKGQRRQDDKRGGDGNGTSWEKNRMWKVMNLEPRSGRSLPVVSRSEPYAPGTGKVPPEDIVVRWLSNGEVLEQIGHSKKTRGYMVMPVRIVRDAKGDDVRGRDGKNATGWVTRRLVDKQRESSVAEGVWLEEVFEEGGGEAEKERRRANRRERSGKADAH
jgi:hypothetical protein